jgi:DedD protein
LPAPPAPGLAPAHPPAPEAAGKKAPATPGTEKPASSAAKPAPPAVAEQKPAAPAQKSVPGQAPAPSAQPPAEAAPVSKGFIVQVGVFMSGNNARTLQKKLAESGIPTYTETRVLVGPFNDRAEAEAVVRQLKEMGLGGVVVAPPGTQ